MALTHRLYELDLLTEWGYRTVCVQLSRLGYRRTEPGIPRESSQLLGKVFRSVRDEGETPAAIAAAIGITAGNSRPTYLGSPSPPWQAAVAAAQNRHKVACTLCRQPVKGEAQPCACRV